MQYHQRQQNATLTLKTSENRDTILKKNFFTFLKLKIKLYQLCYKFTNDHSMINVLRVLSLCNIINILHINILNIFSFGFRQLCTILHIMFQ